MQETIKRLRWQCRRGMLELDLLLSTFLDKHYLKLSASEQALFAQLLTYSDRDLYCYLVNQQPVDNEQAQMLIKRIRGDA